MSFRLNSNENQNTSELCMGDKVTTVTVSAVVYGAVVLCSAVCVAALGVEAF